MKGVSQLLVSVYMEVGGEYEWFISIIRYAIYKEVGN